jgi:hypothetical protein
LHHELLQARLRIIDPRAHREAVPLVERYGSPVDVPDFVRRCGLSATLIRAGPDARGRFRNDDQAMRHTYGVVWRDGVAPLVTGKLELLPCGLRLEGLEGATEIPYKGLAGVHVGRTAAERINGRPSVVVERIGHVPVTIGTVAQSSLVGEIAERLAALQLSAEAPRRLALVVPLRPGADEPVRGLLAKGPPFDPESIPELDRHEVFITPDEVVFVFESERGSDALTAMLSRPDFWKAAGAWEEHVAGPPRLAENAYSWSRVDGPGELSFLPTPGPGDSDGGDIF